MPEFAHVGAHLCQHDVDVPDRIRETPLRQRIVRGARALCQPAGDGVFDPRVDVAAGGTERGCRERQVEHHRPGQSLQWPCIQLATGQRQIERVIDV